MKKLEEVFNLAPLSELSSEPVTDSVITEIQTVEDALTISEKINSALAEVRGMEGHDGEMDEIAQEAIESYKQLMSLGHNMTDMASGPVFANAAAMLKIALEARDSKVTRKLKQIDLMLKKARLDQQEKTQEPSAQTLSEHGLFDRNELLRMLSQTGKKDK